MNIWISYTQFHIYSSLHLITLMNLNSRPSHKKHIAVANLSYAEGMKSKKTETVKNEIACTDHQKKHMAAPIFSRQPIELWQRRFMIKTGSWIGCVHQEFLSLKVAEHSFGSFGKRKVAAHKLKLGKWKTYWWKILIDTGKMWHFHCFHGNMNDWIQP